MAKINGVSRDSTTHEQNIHKQVRILIEYLKVSVGPCFEIWIVELVNPDETIFASWWITGPFGMNRDTEIFG